MLLLLLRRAAHCLVTERDHVFKHASIFIASMHVSTIPK
jgi:hypothetical protein